MTDEAKTRRQATFLGSLIVILSLVVIGYPLAPATIRTMLFGWIPIVAAIMRSIFKRHFEPLGSTLALKPVRVRATNSQRLR